MPQQAVNLIIVMGLVVGIPILFYVLKEMVGIVYIPNDRVGIIEKLWGGSIQDGRIIALNSEAGYQPELLRGGMHFGYPRWKWRIHKAPLVTISQGKIGYVYARDGEALPFGQTLGRVVESNNFQDARMFLSPEPKQAGHRVVGGQKGRQRMILREGVYAINIALFTVITDDAIYTLHDAGAEQMQVKSWQGELKQPHINGFTPVVIGGSGENDNIGIVTVQDGPPLPTGEIIAPEVLNHNSYQDPEAFLTNGGKRGRQYAVLTDGTYFINRWFATVEKQPKIVVPIGYVGVVISYYGKEGSDLSGDGFRHGERVAIGQRGVWDKGLQPGKYAFNTYAGRVVAVPTTNFVLHWIDGRSEAHKFDENLRSIDLVTKDAYEPLLPLSLVVHIDYQKAPGVIQRFGDVKQLITQSIDPMLAAYFRDVSQGRTMLELLQKRDEIQQEARTVLKARFEHFDIECVDVLIGKPVASDDDKGRIEALLDQLRQRQLAVEQVETFDRKKSAAERRRTLEEAEATAAKQKELTNSSVQIEIVKNEANALLAKAEMQKRQTIVEAEGQLEKSRREAEQQIVVAKAGAERTVLVAKATSEQEILLGKGEGTKELQIGIAKAMALRQQVGAYGDPRLYALVQSCIAIAQSKQPLVPERVFQQGGTSTDGTAAAGNPLQTLLSLVLANNTAFGNIQKPEENPAMVQLADRLLNEAAAAMGNPPMSEQAKVQ